MLHVSELPSNPAWRSADLVGKARQFGITDAMEAPLSRLQKLRKFYVPITNVRASSNAKVSCSSSPGDDAVQMAR